MRRYATNDAIPQNGMYYVIHAAHKLIRSVMLRHGDKFPRCSQCPEQVIFELMFPLEQGYEHEPHHVFELPLEEADSESATAS
jgi:hypothetical protein